MDDLELATPVEIARFLRTSTEGLAQLRYRGGGPRFIKVGKKVLYRWVDVQKFLEENTITRTDDPRGAR